MSVLTALKKVPAAVVTHWDRNKETIKSTAVAGLALTSVTSILLLKAVIETRTQYLDERGLTQDYKDYITPSEDDE